MLNTCNRTYECHLGIDRQTMGTDLSPLPRRLVVPFGTIAEQDVLRFSGQKKIPGVPGKWACFLGIWETFVSQMANQEPPVAKGIVFHHRDAGTSWEMELSISIGPTFRRGTTKTRVLFAHVFRGGVSGGQSAVRQTAGCLSLALKEEGKGRHWVFLAMLCAGVDFC